MVVLAGIPLLQRISLMNDGVLDKIEETPEGISIDISSANG
jgi:hypothetical protein